MKKAFYSWDECMQLREVKSLRKLNHPNIVKLKEVIREADKLYFVFEFMGGSLYESMRGRSRGFSEGSVRNIMFQALQGLAAMHRQGYFHRDIKPENILVRGDTVKLADFGLAREVRARPPFTDYVSTRWYRAPEVLLRSTAYNSPVDIFAMGVMMAELFTLKPLLPGASEADQIFKMVALLGTPDETTWPQGLRLAARMRFTFPSFAATPLHQVVPGASEEALALLGSMLAYNPTQRPSAAMALQFPFFSSALRPARSLTMPRLAPTSLHLGPEARPPCVQGSGASTQPAAPPAAAAAAGGGGGSYSDVPWGAPGGPGHHAEEGTWATGASVQVRKPRLGGALDFPSYDEYDES